ncbi:ATP-binding protein [Mycoplasma sp. U97]|uniref:ATP-binding protein n=1 Tax=Mycoplasma tauri TaxID=547987 RepID=UPI001CBB5510|nr:ATP-binding protein [Mycoplasma tauri]MBZ4212695.1 ATP-binding protein [Mycoplasma tauri]
MNSQDIEKKIGVNFLDGNRDQVDQKVLDVIKSHPKLVKAINKLKITDQELLDNIVAFLNIKDSLEYSQVYPWTYNILRHPITGEIIIKRKAAKNNVVKHIKRNINLILTDINNPNLDIKVSQIRGNTPGRKELAKWIKNSRELLENKKIITNDNRIFVFGKNGSGKTFIASAIANNFATRGIRTAYLRTNDLFNFLKSKMNNSIEISEILTTLKNVPMLLLDGVGSEKHNKWFKYDFLYEILQYRTQYNKPTAIFSIFSPIHLKNIYSKIENDSSNNFRLDALIYEMCSRAKVFNIDDNLEFM